MRIFLLTCLCGWLLASGSLRAQPYETSLGLRFGSSRGLALKHSFQPAWAGEAQLVHRRGGLRLVTLTLWQPALDRREQYHLLLGGGGHAGYDRMFDPESSPTLVYGPDLLIGLSFSPARSPFTFSFDLKPLWEARQGLQFSGNNAAFTLRYQLGQGL